MPIFTTESRNFSIENRNFTAPGAIVRIAPSALPVNTDFFSPLALPSAVTIVAPVRIPVYTAIISPCALPVSALRIATVRIPSATLIISPLPFVTFTLKSLISPCPIGSYNTVIEPLAVATALALVAPCPLAVSSMRILPVPLNAVETYKTLIAPVPLNASPVYKTLITPVPLQARPVSKTLIAPVPLRPKSPITHTDTWDIRLDGKSIKGFSAGVDVIYQAGAVHNEISVRVISAIAYHNHISAASIGSSQLTLITNAVTETFLFEQVSGFPRDCTLWGRSLSALHDKPYSYEEIEKSSYMASALASELIDGIIWSAHDWYIPDYQFTGSEVAAVQDIAETCGAVLRCNLDGGLEVRPRRVVRPVDMDLETPQRIITASDMFNPSTDIEAGENINGITVNGLAAEDTDFDVVIESNPQPVVGGDAYVRLYYQGATPSGVLTSITAGYIQYVGRHTESFEEVVQFSDGFGNTSRPVHSLLSYTYIGDAGGAITAPGNASKTLFCTSENDHIATVLYQTAYLRFACRGARVAQAIGKILTPLGPDVSANVVFGDGSQIAPDIISDNRILDINTAVVRATAELDKRAYDMASIKFQTPHDDALMADGGLMLMDNPRRGISANYYIDEVRRNYRRAKIMSDITARRVR